MKQNLLCLVLIFSLFVCSLQAQRPYFLAGVNNRGIAFGNSMQTNGIRLNVWDRHAQKVNGINLSGKTQTFQTNGIATAILFALDSITNGIRIAGIASAEGKSNGIAIGGIGCVGTTLNGIAAGGIVLAAEKHNGVGAGCLIITDTMNGVFVAPHGIFAKKNQGYLRGVSISAFVCRLFELKGLSIAALTNINTQKGVVIGLYNRTEHLHGVQFGLWNVAMNKKHLKKLPGLNVHFKAEKKNG